MFIYLVKISKFNLSDNNLYVNYQTIKIKTSNKFQPVILECTILTSCKLYRKHDEV